MKIARHRRATQILGGAVDVDFVLGEDERILAARMLSVVPGAHRADSDFPPHRVASRSSRSRNSRLRQTHPRRPSDTGRLSTSSSSRPSARQEHTLAATSRTATSVGLRPAGCWLLGRLCWEIQIRFWMVPTSKVGLVGRARYHFRNLQTVSTGVLVLGRIPPFVLWNSRALRTTYSYIETPRFFHIDGHHGRRWLSLISI